MVFSSFFRLNTWIYFQKACGSLTNLLKMMGSDGTEPSDNPTGDEGEANVETNQSGNVAAGGSASISAQQDMQRKMSTGLDKLDALSTKTGSAKGHTNQSKSFLQ